MFFTQVDWSKYGIDYAGYATGGYTGSWGPDGRLAILHEKELVLNADDTKNFLTATTALRELSKLIDLEAMSNRFAFDFGSLFSNFTNDFGSTIDQRVQIEAHFPNATDRNEISEALNNLINTASQYANRKV